jgi:Na+/H+ antiporter NhaA
MYIMTIQTTTISKLIQISIIIGLGTTATTFIGGMVFPAQQDWRDLASYSILGTIISAHYAIQNSRLLF